MVMKNLRLIHGCVSYTKYLTHFIMHIHKMFGPDPDSFALPWLPGLKLTKAFSLSHQNNSSRDLQYQDHSLFIMWGALCPRFWEEMEDGLEGEHDRMHMRLSGEGYPRISVLCTRSKKSTHQWKNPISVPCDIHYLNICRQLWWCHVTLPHFDDQRRLF